MFYKLSEDVFDKENKQNLNTFSKQIKKESRNFFRHSGSQEDPSLKKRRIFGDITNNGLKKNSYTQQVKENIKKKNYERMILNHNVYLEDKFTIADEPHVSKTTNFTTLAYHNIATRRIYKFYCFDDKDLNVPPSFTAKTISHSIDNDCNTDDGQLKGAISKLFRNMEKNVQQMKEVQSHIEERSEFSDEESD